MQAEYFAARHVFGTNTSQFNGALIMNSAQFHANLGTNKKFSDKPKEVLGFTIQMY